MKTNFNRGVCGYLLVIQVCVTNAIGGENSAGWWPCPLSPRKVLITEYNMMHSAGSTRGGDRDTFYVYSMYQNGSN